MKKSPLFLLCAFLLLAGCDKLPLGMGGTSNEAQVSSQKLTAQGYELIAQQQPSAAVAIFDQAIGGDAKNIRAYQGKGIALNKLGKHDEAETAYAEALKIDPNAVGVTNNLAMSKILRGKYQEAIDLLSPLANAPAPNDTVVENLALANCLMGKNDAARKLYGKNLAPAEIDENLQFCKKYEGMRKKK